MTSEIGTLIATRAPALSAVYQQSHDQQPILGMVRGEAGADHGSAHRRNGPYYDTAQKRGGFIHDAYRLGLLCPNTFGPSHSKFKSLTRSAARCNGGRSPFAGSGGDIDRHPILESQRQPPERPSGFSVILRGRKRSLSPVTFASLLTSPGRGRRAVPSTVADGNCRGAHVAASALLFGLSQNDPYHRVQSAPCHILKRLSSARVERHHESTSERTQSWVSRSKDAFSL